MPVYIFYSILCCALYSNWNTKRRHWLVFFLLWNRNNRIKENFLTALAVSSWRHFSVNNYCSAPTNRCLCHTDQSIDWRENGSEIKQKLKKNSTSITCCNTICTTNHLYTFWHNLSCCCHYLHLWLKISCGLSNNQKLSRLKYDLFNLLKLFTNF